MLIAEEICLGAHCLLLPGQKHKDSGANEMIEQDQTNNHAHDTASNRLTSNRIQRHYGQKTVVDLLERECNPTFEHHVCPIARKNMRFSSCEGFSLERNASHAIFNPPLSAMASPSVSLPLT